MIVDSVRRNKRQILADRITVRTGYAATMNKRPQAAKQEVGHHLPGE